MTRIEHEAAMRAEHGEIFQILDGLAGNIETFLQTLAIKREDGLGVIKSSLLLRLATGLEALGLLAARGYYTEAVGQKRSLMEALARLAALSKKSDLLDEYLMQDELNKVKIVNDVIEFRKAWTPDIPRVPPDEELHETLKVIHQRIDEYNKNARRKLRDIKTFDWAKFGEVEHLFHGHYPISSQALHHAPRDLERRFVVKDDELIGIAIGPEPGDVPALLLEACKFVFVGVQWFAVSVGLEVPEEINALYQTHTDAYERLADEALDRRA